MCGIAGGTGAHGSWIEKAIRCLGHRGPDRFSTFSDSEVELGHARLAIIDLSPEADQPMFTEDRTAAIVFNGEVYNFQEWRVRLQQEGHKFRTYSDTEVLLKLYQLYGCQCLQYVNGMFAFGIWDFREKQLFLARDRLGEKPLYYSILPDGNLLFASEIKALLRHPVVSREVSTEALDDYLSYLYIPGARTIFRNLFKLTPGESLTWKDNSVRLHRYWQLPKAADHSPSLPELEAEIDRRITKSIRQSLIADVPIGIFLSGGIDSSAIVAAAAEQSARLKTFTVVFEAEGARYDEREAARAVASRFGTEHHELLVCGRSSALLPTIVKHFDQPFGNPTALLTYQISQQTRQQVTVVVGGDGGDEIFGGYPRYSGIQWSEKYRKTPAPLRRCLSALRHLLPESNSGLHHLRRLKEFLGGNTQSWEQMYLGWVGYFDRALKDQLYTTSLRQRLGAHQSEAFLYGLLEGDDRPFLDRAIECDLQSFLPYNVLEYGDKMTMAHGLELRLPFLNVDLVSLMARVPGELKLKGGKAKYLLRRVMRDKLPAQILDRGKVGFNAPMGIWIERDLSKIMDEYLGAAQLRRRGYFNHEAISQMRALHSRRRRDFSLHLWALLVLEEWHRQYIDP